MKAEDLFADFVLPVQVQWGQSMGGDVLKYVVQE